MQADSLVMLSGGLDSVVMTYQMREQGLNPRCVYFYLGRDQQSRELASINKLSSVLNIPVQVFNLPDLDKNFYGLLPPQSFLADELDVDGGGGGPRKRNPTAGGLGSLVALSIFYAYAHEVSAVYIGAIASQTRSIRLRSFFDEIGQSFSTLLPAYPSITIKAPFAEMEKSDVVRLGAELKVPLEDTWSCFKAQEVHCGVCAACQSRKLAFEQAGIEDVTDYLK